MLLGFKDLSQTNASKVMETASKYSKPPKDLNFSKAAKLKQLLTTLAKKLLHTNAGVMFCKAVLTLTQYSDLNLDLTALPLPIEDDSFQILVGRHVAERVVG